MNPSLPTETQLDALREVANIGCGQAASALSRLVGNRRVSIGVPRVVVADSESLPEVLGGADAPVVAISFSILGELGGRLLLVLSEPGAHRLAGLLIAVSGEGRLREEQRSALAETANILASACLSAIGKLANLRVMPSVPSLSEDRAGAVVDEALETVRPGSRSKVVVLEAAFFTAGAAPVEGQLLVIPDGPSLELLLGRLGL